VDVRSNARVIVHVRVKHSDIRRHTARKMAATDDDDEYE